MNRRDRRRLSKNLGIMQYQQKLPIKKKFDLIAGNIIEGKKIHQENVEKIRISENAQLEEKESQVLYSLAEEIAKRKKIPVIDALKEAQLEYAKQKK